MGEHVTAIVTAVSRSAEYTFTKPNHGSIRLLAGLGVEGDVHSGVTVKHRSRVRQDPTQPNLRQVHLMHAELHDELTEAGLPVTAGQLGENVTTRGIDLLSLPAGTLLRIGPSALIKVTGLRNPCAQIEAFSPGMLARVVGRDEDGNIVRRAGIMAIVLTGGPITVGDPIRAGLPPEPHVPLDKV
jgi:MOSC domain-containing protein YiiM